MRLARSGDSATHCGVPPCFLTSPVIALRTAPTAYPDSSNRAAATCNARAAAKPSMSLIWTRPECEHHRVGRRSLNGHAADTNLITCGSQLSVQLIFPDGGTVGEVPAEEFESAHSTYTDAPELMASGEKHYCVDCNRKFRGAYSVMLFVRAGTVVNRVLFALCAACCDITPAQAQSMPKIVEIHSKFARAERVWFEARLERLRPTAHDPCEPI